MGKIISYLSAVLVSASVIFFLGTILLQHATIKIPKDGGHPDYIKLLTKCNLSNEELFETVIEATLGLGGKTLIKRH